MKTIFKHKTLTALFSILVTLCMFIGFIGIGTTTAFAADTTQSHTHCSCGLETDVCDTVYSDHHKDIDFPVWESANRMPVREEMEGTDTPKVYYYLVHDVDISGKFNSWEIENEGRVCNIVICLDGHTITNTDGSEEAPVINIWRGGRLQLTTCGLDSMDGSAEITHAEGALGSGVWVGGQQEITSRNKGYFYFYGGNIVRNTSTTNGGGVWVLPDGKFEMHRGSISGNTAYGNGGGVYNTGMFDMYGGTISDNNAQGQGDGVYNANIFNMTGGTISGAGVAIENTGAMTISGGTVSGSQGIRNVDNGTVKLSGNPTISSALGMADICCLSTNEGQIEAEGYTGKTLKVSIDGTTDGQDNFDLMLNKVIVKNTTADKFILVDSMGNTYTDYALVQEGNDLVLHEHNYTYSVSGNIVTESCTCGHEKKATLSAPTGELVYNGNSFNASIAYDTGWVGEQPTEISYTKNTVVTSDTTGAGDYIASITIENKIASVTYKIEKATPTDISWPTGLKGNAGDRLDTIILQDGFTWITPNRVMDYHMMDAEIRYQPNANYNPVENSVSIEVDDDKDPTGTISIGDKTWSSFVEKENITFNTFFSEKQTVTITVDDGKYGSGVDYDELGYYISTKKKSINELSNMTHDTWKKYTGAFEIKPNGEYIIYVRFQDCAHNMTYLSSDGIVLDSKAPTISGITNGETYHGAVEATVSDTYFDRVEIGGVEVAVIDGKFTVNPASGAQEIIAYDKAGNMIAYTITVNKITVTKPTADNTAFTYNGKEQTYTIAESELYTVTNNKREDAGMQKVTVALKDKINYEWADGTTNDLEYEFNIKKATPGANIFDFTAPINLNACDGLAKEATVTEKEGIEGVGSITIKYFKGETGLTGAPTAVGTYTVKIEVAGGANYEPATLTDEAWTFTFDIADEAAHTGVTLKSNENGTHDKFCTVCEKVIESGVACSGNTTDDCDKGYKCSCGGYFGTKEHNFSGAYLSDDNGHWHECAYCAATDMKENHSGTDDGYCTTPVTCSCGHIITEAEDDHTGGTATCQAQANCSVCGTAYGEFDANNHSKTTFVYTANADGTTHTKKYECCGEIALDSEAHTYGADDKCVCSAEKPIPTYTVTVENGTASNGNTSIVVNENGSVTVTANAAPEGKQFKGWSVNGTVVSTEQSYTFNATADTTITAVYEDIPKNSGCRSAIGIGSAVVVVALIGVTVFFIRKKKA